MTIPMASENVTSALRYEYCAWARWTFITNNKSRILVQFQTFSLEEFEEDLAIGDGPIPSDDTRMVLFSGDNVPSNVTSVSNALWIQFQYVINSCCRTAMLHFTISSVTESGTFHFMFEVIVNLLVPFDAILSYQTVIGFIPWAFHVQ